VITLDGSDVATVTVSCLCCECLKWRIGDRKERLQVTRNQESILNSQVNSNDLTVNRQNRLSSTFHPSLFTFHKPSMLNPHFDVNHSSSGSSSSGSSSSGSPSSGSPSSGSPSSDSSSPSSSDSTDSMCSSMISSRFSSESPA